MPFWSIKKNSNFLSKFAYSLKFFSMAELESPQISKTLSILVFSLIWGGVILLIITSLTDNIKNQTYDKRKLPIYIFIFFVCQLEDFTITNVLSKELNCGNRPDFCLLGGSQSVFYTLLKIITVLLYISLTYITKKFEFDNRIVLSPFYSK